MMLESPLQVTRQRLKRPTHLVAAGYKVIDNTANGSLLFNGAEVESGQIGVSQPKDHEGFMIQVNVSRRQ